MPDRTKTVRLEADGTKKRSRPKTKARVIDDLAMDTGLSKKHVADVLTALNELIGSELAGPGGPGQFIIPGLVQLKVKLKAATREKHTVNPLSGTPLIIPARPERRVVVVKGVKPLRDRVAG